ncbi:MAG: hypothetical protein K9H25_22345 [Rhodospirillum sp.]|nr:hypothetical protein [Rhodospirillum sp.]MCF8491849.1 hypothetical protein [Rhodospirillum sp.]MCF8501150.1 hypothetical protein [Rhodospirillum sp.]
MSFLSAIFGARTPAKPADPYWQRNSALRYARLLQLYGRTERLSGRGGVFITWNTGVKGRWIYCGHCTDMALAVRELCDAPKAREYEARSALFFTWAPIKPELRDGAVKYLRETLSFALEDSDLDQVFGLSPARIKAAKDVPVLPPG